jgi:hypothetical protein
MGAVDPKLYNAANEDFESSHNLFRKAFNESFPWEVLKVYTGPPSITFSWRHWGEFVGDYKGNKGEGQLLEMTGYAIVSVTDELKITDIKIYYKPEDFLRALQGNSTEDSEKSKQQSDEIFLENLLKTFATQKEKFCDSENSKFEVNGKDVTSVMENFNHKPEIDLSSWKVSEIFSGSKEKSENFVFSWRHSKDEKEDAKGLAIVRLNPEKDVKSVQVFYKPETVEESGGCPFMK